MTAIILAAGSGERFGGGTPKQFYPLAGRPALCYTLEAFMGAPSVEAIIVVANELYMAYVEEKILGSVEKRKHTGIVAGGVTRAESTRNALNALHAVNPGSDLVAIHDGARALIDSLEIERVISKARKTGAAILGRKLSDTVKLMRDEVIQETLNRDVLYLAETPQVFDRELILRGHAAYDGEPTDDAQVVEAMGQEVAVVAAEKPNMKLTRQEDILYFETLLSQRRRT